MVFTVNNWGSYHLKKSHFRGLCLFLTSSFALATMTLANYAYISCNYLVSFSFLPELQHARSSDGASCSLIVHVPKILVFMPFWYSERQ